MNREQYFWLGILSLMMLCLSIIFIATGRLMYGSDAILLAVMGWMFYISMDGLISSIRELAR